MSVSLQYFVSLKLTRQSRNAVKFAVVMFTYTSLILKEKLRIILQQNCYSSSLSEGRAQCSQGWTAFSGPPTPSRTALIRDFHQWFCKEKASGGRTGHIIMYSLQPTLEKLKIYMHM